MTGLRPIVAALAVLVGVAAQAQPEPSIDEIRQALIPYASAADAVTLPDGRQLAFVCMGEGSPTVILTSGAGVPAFGWSAVHSHMAETTRVCAWDRAGWGLSDGRADPQTVASTAADLEAALTAGRISGPYVLVGHSLGAYESLLFADRNREQVAGMVLVDPSVPDQFALIEQVAPHRIASLRQQEQILNVFRACADQVRSGTLRIGGPDPDNCVTYPPYMPTVLQQALAEKVIGNPLQYESQASFLQAVPESSRIVVNARRNYGDMPLIVLTATVEPPPGPGASAEQFAAEAAWSEAWNRAHDDLAALSSRGVNARVPGANHNIQNTKPQVVIDAVEAVVAEAREAGS